MAKFKNKKGEKNYRFSWLVILFTQVFFSGLRESSYANIADTIPPMQKVHSNVVGQCSKQQQRKKKKQNKINTRFIFFFSIF